MVVGDEDDRFRYGLSPSPRGAVSRSHVSSWATAGHVSDILSPQQKTGSLTNFTENVCSDLQMLLFRQVGYLMHNGQAVSTEI